MSTWMPVSRGRVHMSTGRQALVRIDLCLINSRKCHISDIISYDCCLPFCFFLFFISFFFSVFHFTDGRTDGRTDPVIEMQGRI